MILRKLYHQLLYDLIGLVSKELTDDRVLTTPLEHRYLVDIFYVNHMTLMNPIDRAQSK